MALHRGSDAGHAVHTGVAGESTMYVPSRHLQPRLFSPPPPSSFLAEASSLRECSETPCGERSSSRGTDSVPATVVAAEGHGDKEFGDVQKGAFDGTTGRSSVNGQEAAVVPVDPAYTADRSAKTEKAAEEQNGAETEADDESKYPGGFALGILTFGLCMATFVVALDNTIIGELSNSMRVR